MFSDYRITCTVQRRGGGSLPLVFNGFAEGPYLTRLDAYKRGVLDALRRAPPPEASGLYCQVYGMAPYPVSNWVPVSQETVSL